MSPEPAAKRQKKQKVETPTPAAPVEVNDGEGLFTDLGHLMITNMAVDANEINTVNMQDHVTECAQHLINGLFKLPAIPSDVGRAVKLPRGETIIPREKPLPKPKEKTVWEQFAEKKGIVKKKKMTRYFDEDLGDWVSTYGKGKAMVEKSRDWVREVKEGYVPKVEGGDPFLDAKMEKKDKIQKQKEREKRNKLRGDAVKRTSVHLKDQMSKLATASHGKFDKWT